MWISTEIKGAEGTDHVGATLDRKVSSVQHESTRMRGGAFKACQYRASNKHHRYLIIIPATHAHCCFTPIEIPLPSMSVSCL
jgi:hypothetical protein